MPNPNHGFTAGPTGNSLLDRVQNAVKTAFDTFGDSVQRAINAAAAAALTQVWSGTVLNTHNDLRRISGDMDGKKGPRAVVVLGDTAYFDGGQGVYGWDPINTGGDNNTTIIVGLNGATKPGRWRKI
ncbi:MAG TPA: hypothetical protein VI384_04510 [Candidatus Dormibacteraeota bacterium]